MRTTMNWRCEGRLFVIVHTMTPPVRAEWQDFVDDLRKKGCGPNRRLLVRTYGGAPNGAQRKANTDVPGYSETPCAVMTSSVVARAIGTGIGWFNPNLRMFGLFQADEALDYLELVPSERVRARQLLAEFESELSIPRATRPTGEAAARR